ncbi:MAG: alpha/beta hydrolase [Eubacteriales bacterium]|nr:alpha/beta hydrolase [Eubacteriales bacterium]
MSDIALFCREAGAGEPLILLHGNGGSSDTFARQMEPFAARYHVYAIDTRGHGQSPRGTADFSLRQFAADLRDFMNARAIPTAHLLGFSDGGNIALLFALRWPDRVRSLILNGANLRPSGMCFVPWMQIDFAYLATGLTRRASHEHELLRLMATQPHISNAQLRGLRTPALVLAGTHDLIRASHTRLIAQKLPDAELCFLPGSHSIVEENSAAYSERVLAFLSNH